MNLGELLESFLRSRVLRPKSVDNYRAVCRRFITFLGADEPLDAITRPRLIEYRDHVLKQASPVTFNNYRCHLRAIFSYAVEIEELSQNPWRRVRDVSVLKLKPKTVSTKDLTYAVDVFRKRALENWGEAGRKWGKFWATLVHTLYYTGMRRRQVVALKWSDIDFEDKTILLRATASKTYLEWTIPLPNAICRELLELRQSVEDFLGYRPEDQATVFDPRPFAPQTRRRMENPLTVERLSLFFRRLSEKADVRMSSQRIRHTTCSTIVNKGKNLKAAQMILGHKNTATTLLYVHPDMDDLRKASDSLELPPDETPR